MLAPHRGQRGIRIHCGWHSFPGHYGPDAAGLAYLYNNENFYLLLKTLADDDTTPILRLVRSIKGSDWETLAGIDPALHERLILRAENSGLTVRFYYVEDDGDAK